VAERDQRQVLLAGGEPDVQPNTETALVSSSTYVNNRLFKTTDPYGRSTFYGYDDATGRMKRSITGTPGATGCASAQHQLTSNW
jgi:hypothetical protein